MTSRRSFLTLLGGAAATWPMAARGQRAAMPVIGSLQGVSAALGMERMAGFFRGLGEAGFVEGRNVAIEYRWADGQFDRLPGMVADLVGRRVTVIATNGAAVSLVKAATSTIPVVFQIGGDPVALGYVSSLNRPGGNLTGVTNLTTEVGPKKLELLHEVVPTARTVVVLMDPFSPSAKDTPRVFQDAAQALGLQVHILQASTERDFEPAFATLARLLAAADEVME